MAKTVSECVYDNEKHSQIASTFSSLQADGRLPEQRPRGPDSVEIPTATPSHSLSDGVFADAPSPIKPGQIPSTSSGFSWVVTNEPASQQMFEADQVPHRELILVRGEPPEQCVSLNTSPFVFTVPSFFLPTIPPELRTPLSFFWEERLQVQISDTTATDLDMKSCVLE